MKFLLTHTFILLIPFKIARIQIVYDSKEKWKARKELQNSRNERYIQYIQYKGKVEKEICKLHFEQDQE